MNTDTPETDSHYYPDFEMGGDVVLADFARKLERERDELKSWTSVNGVIDLQRERDEWKAKYIQQNKDLGCELCDPNGTIWDHAKTLQRERDEARGQRDRLAEALDKVSRSWNYAEVAQQATQSLTQKP